MFTTGRRHCRTLSNIINTTSTKSFSDSVRRLQGASMRRVQQRKTIDPAPTYRVHHVTQRAHGTASNIINTKSPRSAFALPKLNHNPLKEKTPVLSAERVLSIAASLDAPPKLSKYVPRALTRDQIRDLAASVLNLPKPKTREEKRNTIAAPPPPPVDYTTHRSHETESNTVNITVVHRVNPYPQLSLAEQAKEPQLKSIAAGSGSGGRGRGQFGK